MPHLSEVFKKLSGYKENRVEVGHQMHDHVLILILIPTKYMVSLVVGYIKESGAFHLRGRNEAQHCGTYFCASGYF